MEVKERKKVESCKSIETKQQLRWESHKVFETDAPKPGTDQWKQVRFLKTPKPNQRSTDQYQSVPFRNLGPKTGPGPRKNADPKQKPFILAKILYLLSISLYE